MGWLSNTGNVERREEIEALRADLARERATVTLLRQQAAESADALSRANTRAEEAEARAAAEEERAGNAWATAIQARDEHKTRADVAIAEWRAKAEERDVLLDKASNRIEAIRKAGGW